MSDSKFKKAFNGAKERVQKDLDKNLFVTGFWTVGMGIAIPAIVAVPVLSILPGLAAGAGIFFASQNLISGGMGAYKSLKGPKP